MLPFTTSLLRRSFLVPLEIARAYAEAFLPTSSNDSPKPPAPLNRVPSDQSTNSAKAMSTQFYDTQVNTVAYQILFTKRDKEALLSEGRTIVTSAMSDSGFASWQISRFIETLDHDGIEKPANWSDADARDLAKTVEPDKPDEAVKKIKGLKPENLQYLQVDHQIINTFDRKPPRYDRDQVDVLRQIATAIKDK